MKTYSNQNILKALAIATILMLTSTATLIWFTWLALVCLEIFNQ